MTKKDQDMNSQSDVERKLAYRGRWGGGRRVV